MDKFGVPCPRCGSVRVIVGVRADRPTATGPVGVDGKAHVPRWHRGSCEDCRHAFQHDFSFSQ
jgi:hypothetical protein